MYKIKVNNYENIYFSERETRVAKATLLILSKHFCYGCDQYVISEEIEEYEHKKCRGNKALGICYDNSEMPILISEEETKFEDGCYVYHKGLNVVGIVEYANYGENVLHMIGTGSLVYSDCKKVLALPQHFSIQHRKDIISKKLKNETELYVGVDRRESKGLRFEYFIDLESGYVALYPISNYLSTALPVKAGDRSVLYNGQPIPVAFRLIREDKYQELINK